MTIAAARPVRRRNWSRSAAGLGLALAAAAVLLLALGPVGWRAGWWSLRVSLVDMLTYAGYLGLAALVVSVVAVVLGRSGLGWSGTAMAVIGLVLGGIVAYVPWHYRAIARTLPRLNDITTDTTDPPAFVAVVPLRLAEHANPATYPGLKAAALQKRIYPDIVPLVVAMPPTEAFRLALATARKMGWTIDASDPPAGHIEATQRSFWYGFADDIAIRVAASGQGSRIDVRSSARLGRGDFGVNAARVRAYLAALRSASAAPQ